MKQKFKNTVLLLLASIGILLIIFSVSGLMAHFRNQAPLDTEMPAMLEVPTTQDADQTTPNMQYGPGDHPDIDALLRKELNRILDETDFSYRKANGEEYAYAGEHSALFHNQTGVSFKDLQLQVALYKLENPQQYTDVSTIPDLPSEVYDVYIGPLPEGETVPLSFSTEMDDYNYFFLGYGYNLETEGQG